MSGSHTISVPADQYVLTIGGSTALIFDRSSLDATIIGLGDDQGATVIDGNGPDITFSVFGVSGGASLTIGNVTIQNAQTGIATFANATALTANAVTFTALTQHAIRNDSAMTLTNITVSGNGTISFAGAGTGCSGIENQSNGVADLMSVVVTGNTFAGNGNAAGLCNDGNLTMTDGAVSGNMFTGSNGAAIGYGAGVVNFGLLTMKDVVVDGNTSTADLSAGGVYNYSGTAQLNNVTVTNNIASNSDNPIRGTGGVWAARGQLTMTGGVVASNSGDTTGGIMQGQNVTLQNVLVAGNSGGTVGGVDNNPTTAGVDLNVTDSTVRDNDTGPTGLAGGLRLTYHANVSKSTISGNAGVGLRLMDSDGVQVSNATVSGNTGRGVVFTSAGSPPAGAQLTSLTIALNMGGGLSVDDPTHSRVQLRETILADNTGDNCAAPVDSAGDNLDKGETCGFSAPGDLSDADPALGPLQDNGGATFTHALMSGSAAIDAVINNPCPPPATDQRGVSRPQGPACDIGAYEADVLVPNSGVGPSRESAYVLGEMPSVVTNAVQGASSQYKAFVASISNKHWRVAYTRATDQLFAWAEAHGASRLDQIDSGVVEGYLSELATTHAASTVAQELAAIQMLFGRFVSGGVLFVNPASEIRLSR